MVVRTIEVDNKKESEVVIDKMFVPVSKPDHTSITLNITSSGIIKILHKRDDVLINVIFLKEYERHPLFVYKGDTLLFNNLSYQRQLSVYVMTVE
jgi:hypothetical protein